ncbi:MAG: hypothetical protein R3B70_47505 [Polyangiaceae bacterium]
MGLVPRRLRSLAVIQDWNGTPNAPGNVIKQALLVLDPLHWPFFPSTESP